MKVKFTLSLRFYWLDPMDVAAAGRNAWKFKEN
jgi:hypothetical protein